MEYLLALAPPGVPAWATLVLLPASTLASFVTAAFGVGGGVMLLAVMTVFLPVPVVIPLHGVIQAGSNVGRIALTWRHVQWPILAAFAAGAAVGATAGSQLLVRLPQAWMELALGAFILWTCWGPMPRVHRGSLATIGAGGALTSLLTLFVGATGPFVGAFLRALHLDRLHHVGTFSACMVLQHGLKIAVFGLVGFAFGPYVPFLAVMLVAGFIGTCIGRLVLERIDDALFRRGLTLLLTVLALRLVYSGVSATLGGA